MFAIPALSYVNLADLHIEVRARIRRTLLDPRLYGNARASSGARTYAQQKALYDAYKAGYGNLAANPDYVWWNGRKGSAHQVQEAGGYKHGNLSNAWSAAYAIDVGFYGSRLWSTLASVASENNMVLTVAGEPWHFEPRKDSPLIGLSGLHQGEPFVNAGLQQNLKTLGFYNGKIDGLYGPGTMEAVVAFQASTETLKTGDWTVDDQLKLEEVLAAGGQTPADPKVKKMILVRNNDENHSHYGAVFYWPSGQPVGNPAYGHLLNRDDVHIMELNKGETWNDMWLKAVKSHPSKEQIAQEVNKNG